MINPKHYYFKIREYGKITDSLENGYAGMPCNQIPIIQKRIWDENFRLYRETEYILKKVKDPNDFTYFPLYRGIGSSDDDYIFESKEEALREYEYSIGESVYCSMHDC